MVRIEPEWIRWPTYWPTITKWMEVGWTFADVNPVALDVCGPRSRRTWMSSERGPKTSNAIRKVRYDGLATEGLRPTSPDEVARKI